MKRRGDERGVRKGTGAHMGVEVGAETGAERAGKYTKDAFCVSEWRIMKVNTSVQFDSP